MKFGLQLSFLLLTISATSQTFIGKCTGYELYVQDINGIYSLAEEGDHYYDTQGKTLKITQTYVSSGGSVKDTLSYDSNGNLIEHETLNNFNGSWIPHKKRRWTFNSQNLETQNIISNWSGTQYLDQLKYDRYYTNSVLDSTRSYQSSNGTSFNLTSVNVYINNLSNQPIMEYRYTINGSTRTLSSIIHYDYLSNGQLAKSFITSDYYNVGFMDTIRINSYYYNSAGLDSLQLIEYIDTSNISHLVERSSSVYDQFNNEVSFSIEQENNGIWDTVLHTKLEPDPNYLASDIMYPSYLLGNLNIANKVVCIKNDIENGTPWPYRDSIFYTHNSFLSINEISSNEFNIYPNPFLDNITVLNDELNNYHLELIDVNGNIVFSRKIKNFKELVDLTHLSSGAYTLKLTSNNHDFIKYYKLIKN